jgi:glycosyltransferase involved in cell wall biosynthesis
MTKKPRIVVIGLKGLPAYGGAATVGECLINQLKDEFDFTVLSVSSHTNLKSGKVNGYTQLVFKKFSKGGTNTLIYYLKCMFHCLFNKYDLVHLHHAGSGFITPVLRLRHKVIVTFHGIHNRIDPKFSSSHNWFFRFSERLNVFFSNLVVSVSKPDQVELIAKYHATIDQIPNGISIGKNSLTNSKKDEGYIFFAAGRIYEIKGLHLLLKAINYLNDRTLVKIAGDINQKAEYKTEIESLSNDLNIEYLGLIKEKDQLMKLVANATYFVFPSLTEAMSMMLLEVVSMKTPVIASDIPSNRAIFTDQEVLFFESNNDLDLAKKIKYAKAHANEMSERATRAYNKLVKEYNWEVISREYKERYIKLIAAK